MFLKLAFNLNHTLFFELTLLILQNTVRTLISNAAHYYDVAGHILEDHKSRNPPRDETVDDGCLHGFHWNSYLHGLFNINLEKRKIKYIYSGMSGLIGHLLEAETTLEVNIDSKNFAFSINLYC
jgi:hypothetical protein